MTYENVHEFIDRILIHELDRETNTRKIEIHYSFVGQVDTEQEPTQVVNHDRRNMVDVKVSLSNPSKVRSRPSIVDIFIYDIQAMLGGILPEHHALCLNTPAFSLQFIVPAQSHIKRRVVNRSIVRLFHR